jgi:hypothetical protein
MSRFLNGPVGPWRAPSRPIIRPLNDRWTEAETPTLCALERPSRSEPLRPARFRLLILVSGRRGHRRVAGEADTSACRPNDRPCAAERTLATLFFREPRKGFYLRRLTAHTSEARSQIQPRHRPQDLSDSQPSPTQAEARTASLLRIRRVSASADRGLSQRSRATTHWWMCPLIWARASEATVFSKAATPSDDRPPLPQPAVAPTVARVTARR